MRIGIIGTRGIPNQYGGFEQFAELFSVRMAKKGHEVYVYCSHRHPYRADSYKNVNLVHCYDPEHRIGTAGQFIYDLNCILDSRSRNFDIILQLGYTSSTTWSWLYPSGATLVTNMDGLEWRRSKYNRLSRYFLGWAEKWGVKYSDRLIADSKGIQEYLFRKYKVGSAYIPYGAEVYTPGADNLKNILGLEAGAYDLLIARFEPENNIETILKAYSQQRNYKLVLVGNHQATAFGRRMYRKYVAKGSVRFAGPIYDANKLNALRHYSRLYLHGHSVGGTNPSLLEAMGSGALICAHDNVFNRHVLNEAAFYFKTAEELTTLLAANIRKQDKAAWINGNKEKIKQEYNWDIITDKIESCFIEWKEGRHTYSSLCVA